MTLFKGIGLRPFVARDVAESMGIVVDNLEKAIREPGPDLTEIYIEQGVHPGRVKDYFRAVVQSLGDIRLGIVPKPSPKIADYASPPPEPPRL